jgi:hypothetical protein
MGRGTVPPQREAAREAAREAEPQAAREAELESALEAALGAADGPQALALLRELAPTWYRQARHSLLLKACARLEALVGDEHWPHDLALWRALSAWYLVPMQARQQLLALARRRGLEPPGPPQPDAPIGEELYLLAALYRAELAMLAPGARLDELRTAIELRLNAPGRAATPALVQLGGVTAVLSALSFRGGEAGHVAALSAESLALVARLDDRHSLCSAVALARWPLLRGEPARARETCELITVGLLAGDDAHMPLAHGWLMAVQSELAQPGSFDLLRAWADGSMDRAALLASPIAPMLLSALALLDAQAPRHLATGLQALVLKRQDAWTPFERWMARAARCWAHLRDGDVPAARAMLRLLNADAMLADSLPGGYALLLEQQARWLEARPASPALPGLHGQPSRTLPNVVPATPTLDWPGPAMLRCLIAWASGTPVQPAQLEHCERDWREHGLVLPLFTLPALAQAALGQLLAQRPQAEGSPWVQALLGALNAHAAPAPAQAPPPPGVQISLLDGLRITVRGQALSLGRKPPRRLLELTALLALRFPAEQPAARLADALYPELDGDAALHALDTALYRLRRLLPAGSLRRGPVGVAFDAQVVQVNLQGPRERWLPEFELPWAEAARRGQ